MNKNDEDIDLRLALGSRNYSAQTRLHGSSGAGVNANSRLDMPFAASDPLSELVWSPHNGLSLKCADSNLADNKPFRTWNVGESTKEILTSRDTRLGCGDNKVSAAEKLSVSQTMLDGANNSGDKATVFRCSGGSSSSELGVHRKFSHGGSNGLIEKASTADAIQAEKQKGNAEEDLCTLQNVQIANIDDGSKRNAELDIRADATHDRKSDAAINWKLPSKLIRGSRFNQKGRLETNASRSGIMGLAVPIRSEPPTAKVSEALVCSLPNLQARQQIDDEVTSASADVNKTKTDAALSLQELALMKLESSAENDLGHLVAKDVHSSGEMELPREDSLPAARSPTNGRICLYREKGKEKALSEGEIYGRSSNEKDDSHESMESCNSAGLFPKGVKRQQHYDLGQPVGSKRVKKCVQGSLSPTSIIKANSSFMNWITNMVKGVQPDPTKEESSLLALTLAHSNNFCSNNHQERLMSNKTTDFAKPTGFQNVFQSLYCQTNKTYISGVKKNNQFIAESSEHMVADKKSVDSTPQSCNRNNDSSSKQIILSDQEVTPNISRSPIKPWIFSADSATGNSSEKSLAENKALDKPECSKAIIEGNSSASLCKKVDTTADNINLDIPLPVSCIPEKSSPLSSLWVTRLYTRSAKLENCNRVTEEAIGCNSEYPKANPLSRENDVFSIGQKVSEARNDNAGDQVHASEGEMQSFSPKESFDFKFSHKRSPIQPSNELRSSEVMASVFAKRLDALRLIIHPSERRKPPTFPLTCFFCGNSDHDLRKCPELTETELENILVNISSFDRVDESTCFCIRCFQVDHWAISCPLASSLEHRQSKQNAVSVKQHTTCHLSAEEKSSSYLGGGEDDHKQVFAGQVACSRKPIFGSFPSFLTWNMKESSSRRFSTSNELQKSTLSNLENHVTDKRIFPPCKVFDTQFAVPQEEMFHAIRKLRLSRADILRWMDSDVSLSHLNGFFLRLRLGKLEGSLGGTGYYVACITGDSIENIGWKSKKSVLVDVGGVKSSVGSQYISNHDFLEDEIKGWWSRIEKTGSKIPSLDELKSKFEDKKCLGL